MALVELNESRQYEENRRGMTGKRLFMSAWSEHRAVAPPLGSPFPGIPILRVVNRRFIPFGKPKTGILGDEYTSCRIECDYATLLGADDTPTSTLDFAAEILEVGGGRIWTTSGLAINQPLNILLPYLVEEIDVSWPYINIPMLLSLLGKVNGDSWRGAAAGQVRFEGARSRTEWDPDLNWWRNRISLRFTYDPRGHNYAWNSDTGLWDTTVPLLYAAADFSILGL